MGGIMGVNNTNFSMDRRPMKN